MNISNRKGLVAGLITINQSKKICIAPRKSQANRGASTEGMFVVDCLHDSMERTTYTYIYIYKNLYSAKIVN